MSQPLQQTLEQRNEQTLKTLCKFKHDMVLSEQKIRGDVEEHYSLCQRFRTWSRYVLSKEVPMKQQRVRYLMLGCVLMMTTAATPLRSPKDVSPAPAMRQVNINPALKTNVIHRTLTRSEMVHPLLMQEMTNGVAVKLLWTNTLAAVGADFARLSWKGTNTPKVVYLLTDTNATSFQFYGLSNGPPWVIELNGVNAAGDGPVSNVTFWDRWEDTVWNQSRKSGEPFSDFGLPVARWTNTPPDKMREYRLRVGRVRQ